MRDGPVRRAVKRIARLNFDLDIAVHRALRRWRGERPYALGGGCRRCARCCEAPGIQVSRVVWYWPMLRRSFLWWQRQVNGFELAGSDTASRTLIFKCTHFDWRTRSCDSYDSRPGMCRDYPRALLYQANPELFPECGYRPVAPNAARLRAALDKQRLTPEQEAKLKKDLYLDA